MSRVPQKRARNYCSPMRQRQADETGVRICDAARKLLTGRGFDGTTIEAIAQEAGVSAQTVYSIFESKRGILAALVNRARFGPEFQELVARATSTTDPKLCLTLLAGIARQVYDGERSELDVLRGAGVVAPELEAMTRDRECERYDGQVAIIELLVSQRRLKADLDKAGARDVLWALTGHESYRLLVVERGWSADRYEEWLGGLLHAALLRPVARRRRS